MKQNLSILFYLKKARTAKNGEVPIYLRITFDGKRSEAATQRKIFPTEWSYAKGEAKGSSETSRTLNVFLLNIKNKIQNQYNILISKNETVTAEALRNAITGAGSNKHTILGVFDYHNKRLKERVGIDFAPGTEKRYKVTYNKVRNFIKYQYKKNDVFLEDVDHQFLSNFEYYLVSHDSIAHNTCVRYVKHLRKIINIALSNKWIISDPFVNFKLTYKETNRGYLTQEELHVMQDKNFTIPRLAQVRDMFIFSCYTGLSFSDTEALSKENIITGIDGEQWINTFRKKNDSRTSLPLLPMAKQIIENYKDHPKAVNRGRLLPMLTNQKINAYLKEIADICGIQKTLTFHLARHTFATTVTLCNGVPIETVSKMLGHSSIKTTQIYSKVVDSKISQDMKTLKQKLHPAEEVKTVRIA